MGTEYGKEWRLHIGDGADPEVFEPLGGEGTWSFSRSSKEMDTSSKDDGNYDTSTFGKQKITISVSGITKLPDDGLELAFDTAKSFPPEANFKLLKGAVVKYAGSMAIGNQKLDGPKDAPVSWAFDLVAAAAPTTDDLGATA